MTLPYEASLLDDVSMEKGHVSADVLSYVVFSSCGSYRYALTREWDLALPKMTVIMLNPSTANHLVDDPTIARCTTRARRLGFGALYVANLFAWRATSPKDMLQQDDPVGPRNDGWIGWMARAGSTVLCAWGAHGSHRGRDVEVVRMLRSNDVRLTMLGMTKGGQPKHPLYLPLALEPQEFS